jgi:transcription initiation factor TFIIIB Brf1 subunit/transcription initiation factor TFIIB
VWCAQQYERRRIKMVVTIKEIAEMSGVSRGIVKNMFLFLIIAGGIGK